MNKAFQRLEAVVGIALIWGALWMLIGFIVGNIIWVLDPDSIDPGEEPYLLAPWIGLVGVMLGATFGGLLFLVERRKTLFDLPLGRVAVWGFLVAAALAVVTGKDLGMTLILGPLGALSAIAAITILRKGLPLAKAN